MSDRKIGSITMCIMGIITIIGGCTAEYQEASTPLAICGLAFIVIGLVLGKGAGLIQMARTNPGKTAKVIGVIGALLFAFLVFSMFANSPSTSNREITCGYCHKSYSITSSNGKNISKTRLCNSCYAFYDSASDVLGK